MSRFSTTRAETSLKSSSPLCIFIENFCFNRNDGVDLARWMQVFCTKKGGSRSSSYHTRYKFM